MSVLGSSLDAPLYGDLPEPCFLCSEDATFPLIHWLGATGSIYFHPDCAVSFIRRLGRDVVEAASVIGSGAA